MFKPTCPILARFFSSPASENNAGVKKEVFNRALKIIHKNRSAKNRDWDQYEYLRQDAAKSIIDRINFIKNKNFKNVLEIGAANGTLTHLLSDTFSEYQNFDICENSSSMLENARKKDYKGNRPNFILGDEEFLPLAPSTYDLIVSSLNLHWVNEPDKVFKDVYNILNDNGVFIFGLLGGSTLKELSSSFYNAQIDSNKGFCPRTCPLCTAPDVASLLFTSGFVSSTVDVEKVMVEYSSLLHLMKDIQKMGESNCTHQGATFLSKKLFRETERYYKKNYRSSEKFLLATYEIIYGIGWKSQSKSQLDTSKDEEELVDFNFIDKL